MVPDARLTLLNSAASMVTIEGGFQEIAHSPSVASAVRTFFSNAAGAAGSEEATALPDQLQSKRKVFVYNSEKLSLGQKVQLFLTSLFYKYIDVSKYKDILTDLTRPPPATEQPGGGQPLKELQTLRAENERQKASLEAAQKKLSDLTTEYRIKLAELQSAIEEKNTQLKQTNTDLSEKEGQIAQLKTKVSTAASAPSTVALAPTAASSPPPPREAEISAQKQKLAEKEQQIKDLEGTRESLRSEMAALTVHLNEVTATRNTAADYLVGELKAALQRSLGRGWMSSQLQEVQKRPEQTENIIIFEESTDETGKPVVQIFAGLEKEAQIYPDNGVAIQEIINAAWRYATKYWVSTARSIPKN